MKKLLLTLVFLFGAFAMVNAQTTMKIQLPTGESKTFQISDGVKLPCCNEVVNYQSNTKSTERWSFPVYWWTDEGSGSFTMSGDATDMCGIITVLENMFDLNIGGC